MSQQDFLFELGSEELPPKSLKKLAEALLAGVEAGLKDADLNYANARYYAAPRRLAVLVSNLDTKQADKTIEKRGPAVQAAYDADGNPTKAAEGFARGCGTTVDQCYKLETEKGAWIAYKVEQQGVATSELLPNIVTQALNKLPIAKRMRWADHSYSFVRPVKWITMMLGSDTIACEMFGLQAGNQTFGHRFHAPAATTLNAPSDYCEALRKAYVLADYDERKALVEQYAKEAAATVGGEAIIDSGLLDEVCSLNEWPKPIVGSFSDKYLQMPPEVIIYTIQDHQKYFPVNIAGKLSHYFITMANIDSAAPEKVADGNERVVRPRLDDALFFWQQDQKVTLAARREKLKPVVFQSQLGSVFEKTERVAALAEYIAGEIGGDSAKAKTAAELSRSDLVTHMVYEVPEVQGLMGRYYGEIEGLENEVCTALEEQYWPRFSGDNIPTTKTGTAVSLAERLDTLAGIFSIGKQPTGDKDPYALRRACIGLLRIVLENQIDCDISAWIAKAVSAQPTVDNGDELTATITQYLNERYRVFATSELGYSPQSFDAVIAKQQTQPTDIQSRLAAVAEFAKSADAEALAAANKRASNILRKSAGGSVQGDVDEILLSDNAEKSLFSELKAAQSDVNASYAAKDYQAVLSRLSVLRGTVDTFFDEVTVMADDEAVKQNRLALLSTLTATFGQVADLSLLA